MNLSIFAIVAMLPLASSGQAIAQTSGDSQGKAGTATSAEAPDAEVWNQQMYVVRRASDKDQAQQRLMPYLTKAEVLEVMARRDLIQARLQCYTICLRLKSQPLRPIKVRNFRLHLRFHDLAPTHGMEQFTLRRYV